jgi:hypothetical protein
MKKHKIIANSHKILHKHHHLIHIGELLVLCVASLFTLVFAGSTGLPNNTSLSYPLQQVSLISCRTQAWDDISDKCKINLPIIQGANYEQYQDSILHKQIYTVLRASPYKDERNQNVGAHAGVDIASSRGTPLYSIGDGVITYAGRQAGYGNVVKIKYLFQGKYIHAVYGHMDRIDVQAGENVQKDQQVWTVWNSGNTFGELGWYHVHFEINKDNHGRPMYWYLNCPDLNKGHLTIIQEGLCREQLLENTFDPIRTIALNTLSSDSLPITPIKNEQSIQIESTITENTTIETIQETSNNPNKIIPEQNHTSPSIWNQEKNDKDIEQTSTTTEISKDNNESNIQETVLDTDLKRDIDSNYEEETNSTIENFIFKPNTQDFPAEIKHFLSQRTVFTSGFENNQIQLQESETTIPIYIQRKNSENLFKGILSYPITIIPSNNNISINLSTIQLIQDGKFELIIQKEKEGTTTLLLQLGNYELGKIFIY